MRSFEMPNVSATVSMDDLPIRDHGLFSPILLFFHFSEIRDTHAATRRSTGSKAKHFLDRPRIYINKYCYIQ